MQIRVKGTLAGTILLAGVGLALAGGVASADAIDDAWPYPGFYLAYNQLGAAHGGVNLGLFGYGDRDYGYYDYNTGDPVNLFSAHEFWGNLGPLAQYSHQTVFDSAGSDPSEVVPSDGTVAEHFQFGIIPLFVSLGANFTLFDHAYIDDPEAGVGDRLMFLGGGLVNTYISDAAGTRDVLRIFGEDYTLFDVPSAAGGAEATFDPALFDAALFGVV